jgi:hypothetical protein
MRYPTIKLATTLVGAVHDRETDVSPATPATPCGALGARYGDAAKGEVQTPLPALLVAATLNAYVAPFVSPVAVKDVALSAAASDAQVTPPSSEICREYPVTALPPFDTGAAHERATSPVPAVATNDLGTAGVVNGVAAVEVVATPGPTMLIALTRNSYKVAFTRPVTVWIVALDCVSATTVDHAPVPTRCSTRYPVMPAPPFEAGAVQRNVT